MKALVSGHRGFVGRHIFAALQQRGYHVTGVDIADGHAWANDLRYALDTCFGVEQHFDLVVHCAAVVGGRTMIDGQPLHLLAEDLSIDAALFRWALRTKPGRIVYYSSSAAYPVDMQTMDHPQTLRECDVWRGQPDQTYGLVKRVGMRLAEEANKAGIRTHVFLPFSGYGSDQSLDYPWPSIVARARALEDPIVIWSNGVRDWVHIDDVVGATLAAIDNDVLGPVNICTGIGVSFKQLAVMAADQAGYRADVTVLDGMPTGVHSRVGDASEMNRFYIPKVSLQASIRRALAA